MNRTLRTRRPTGRPSWPIVLLAGKEGAGKSWSAIAASGSDVIERCYVISVGEDEPDEYALIPGADFEIVEHDGTYRDILNSIHAVAALPREEAERTLLVIDSMSRVWQLLTDMAQHTANLRAKRKAEKYNKPIPEDDVQIGMDLWNVAASQWGHIMDAIRAHQGPTILTARMEQVSVMDKGGNPTTEKTWKIQGHKTLPFDVTAIIEMPERGSYTLTKLKSAVVPIAQRVDIPNFTVEKIWKRIGLLDQPAGQRVHANTVSQDSQGNGDPNFPPKEQQ